MSFETIKKFEVGWIKYTGFHIEPDHKCRYQSGADCQKKRSKEETEKIGKISAYLRRKHTCGSKYKNESCV